jgi:Ca2+-binding RTX toxin-like protein
VIASTSYALSKTSDVEILQTINHTATTALNLTGNEFANTVAGNAGANILDGKGGVDRLHGYGGNDTYYVDNASDRVYETTGNGTDRVIASVSYALAAGTEVEILQTANAAATTAINLTGNEFANTLIGNAGINILTGRDGSDTYHVGNAADQVIEGLTGDTDRVTTSVSYTLAQGCEVEILQAVSHTATTAMNLTGNEFDNTVAGTAGANTLRGEGGGDKLYGYDGNDRLYGGDGNDSLYGGEGNDTFVFDRAPSATNRDAIADLDVIDDTIWLDDAAFSAVGPVGFLVSEAFYAGPAAHDASDRILYDITNGRLYYDADGTGSGAATLIAYLDAGLNVTASDFHVV